MDNDEFTRIRRYLGKSQNQIARLLRVSPKAVQSFEQGWRRIPVYIERQLLVLFSMNPDHSGKSQALLGNQTLR